MSSVEMWHGDCLGLMGQIPDGSVDAIIADLPYGKTACKWDSIIPLEPLWSHYRRVIKRNGAVVLFASQPFTSALVMSNPKWFRYEWIWDKRSAGNCTLVKKQPLRVHESVLVFSFNPHIYNPQMEKRGNPRQKGTVWDGEGTIMGAGVRDSRSFNDTYYPRSILPVSNANRRSRVHPTQKPVALLEYLIKTYTNEGETVLDNSAGSGTTGVAAINTGRSAILIEKGEEEFKVMEERIRKAQGLQAVQALTLEEVDNE